MPALRDRHRCLNGGHALQPQFFCISLKGTCHCAFARNARAAPARCSAALASSQPCQHSTIRTRLTAPSCRPARSHRRLTEQHPRGHRWTPSCPQRSTTSPRSLRKRGRTFRATTAPHCSTSAYVSVQELPEDERVALARDISLAALLGDSIFSFAELLLHPVVRAARRAPCSSLCTSAADRGDSWLTPAATPRRLPQSGRLRTVNGPPHSTHGATAALPQRCHSSVQSPRWPIPPRALVEYFAIEHMVKLNIHQPPAQPHSSAQTCNRRTHKREHPPARRAAGQVARRHALRVARRAAALLLRRRHAALRAAVQHVRRADELANPRSWPRSRGSSRRSPSCASLRSCPRAFWSLVCTFRAFTRSADRVSDWAVPEAPCNRSKTCIGVMLAACAARERGSIGAARSRRP